VLITTEMFDGAPLRVEQHGGRPVILWNFEIKGVEDMVTALDGATSGHAAEVTR
jgi:hypothetical protein